MVPEAAEQSERELAASCAKQKAFLPSSQPSAEGSGQRDSAGVSQGGVQAAAQRACPSLAALPLPYRTQKLSLASRAS